MMKRLRTGETVQLTYTDIYCNLKSKSLPSLKSVRLSSDWAIPVRVINRKGMPDVILSR